MAQAKSSDLKKKKKKWVSILSPKDFGSVEIGETYVDESEKAMGKVVCANLMNLSRDPKKQNIQLYFKVTSVNQNEAGTALTTYEIVPAYLKRITKRAEERVDNSFIAKSSDNILFHIKPVLMTKGVTHKSIATALRKKTEQLINELAKKTTFDELMKIVIANNIQRDLKNELKKVYPLNSCMIRFLGKVSSK